MDDLVIEGKTYLSSKRAAEVTGYAKDYVGQLCREGRVEARLVGRSWYVLEGSIREHRFGKQEHVEEEAEAPVEEIEAQTMEEEASPWNSPKYVSEEVAPLPELRPKLIIDRPLNLLARTDIADISNVEAIKEEVEESRLPEAVPATQAMEGEVSSEEETSIAIHKVPEIEKPYIPQPRVPEIRKSKISKHKKRKSSLIHTSIVIGAAIVALTVILIGTGYIESAPFEGKNESLIDYLGGKSFYSK